MNDSPQQPASASEANKPASGADASLPDTVSEKGNDTREGREEARLHDADPASAVAEAIRRSGGGEEPKKSTRPPIWLIVFTLMIPLAIAYTWYQSALIRPLTCQEVVAKLQGSDPAEHRHALEWVGRHIDDWNKAQTQQARDLGIVREWSETLPCVESVLTYIESTPPDSQLYFDIARALGSFHAVRDQTQKDAAFRWLENVVLRLSV
ncbi:MAG: hypothetical protein KDB07_09450, partial [Planctomycetes bacterium]|nr:hypothetical protein [Planctomycetota bacterium]